MDRKEQDERVENQEAQSLNLLHTVPNRVKEAVALSEQIQQELENAGISQEERQETFQEEIQEDPEQEVSVSEPEPVVAAQAQKEQETPVLQEKRKTFFSKERMVEVSSQIISVLWNVIRCLLTGFYRLFKFIVQLTAICILTGIIVGCFLFCRYHTLYTNIRQTEYDRIANLSKETFSNLNETRIYDDKGKLLAELSAADYEYVQIKDVSRYIQEGYIAMEDKNFKEHIGIDFTALLRAAGALVKNNGEITQGGSTITQQVVKNTLLTSEQTYVRKCAEILLAIDLEKKFTKAQIMEFYVNSNFYGNQCYGVEAACQYYFGKSAEDVSISEAAMIVGMSNSPSRYNPVANYDLAIEKRDSVLYKMYDRGVITKAEWKQAKADDLRVVSNRAEAVNESYQVSYAIYSAVVTLMEQEGFEFQYVFDSKEEYQKYREKYSEVYSEVSERVRSGGYDIYTSLNTKKQKKLQKSVNQVLAGFTEKQTDGRYAVQGASVCVDNETGYVVAIVGGRGTKDQYNRAYLAQRQPGSTIKPLLDYAPAFESGDYYPSKIMNDHAITNGPRNSGGSYRGNVSMREAIARSINTIAYQTLQGIGVDTGLSYLASMRFRSLSYVDNNNLTISIGGFTNGVRVVDMAKGYSTLAAGGTYIERTCICKIVQQGEGLIFNDTRTSHQVFLEDTAWLMTDCLRGTMELPYGTGRGCALDGQVCAGKTGTTNDSKDGWFCGYTTRYTTSVWVGRDDNQSISGMYGATYAGKIWQSFMNEIHKNLPKESFSKPTTVKKKYVDSYGKPTDSVTSRQDYFSLYAENKRSLLEQQREEAAAQKSAEKEVTKFEKFEIEKVEDCYQVEKKYQKALNAVSVVTTDNVRVELSTRVADKYAALQKELKNWEKAMAAYEIEQARKEEEARQEAARKAAELEAQRQKNLAITRFNNAIKAVQEYTDKVEDYTYVMLDLAYTYLKQCKNYPEYQSMLQVYNTEKQRIEQLAGQSIPDEEEELETEEEVDQDDDSSVTMEPVDESQIELEIE